VLTELKVDAYVAAVGRKPNTQGLNLDSAGIKMDEYGGVLVNSQLATTAKLGNVYAAGDVVGRPFLASTGCAQAKAALLSMWGRPEDVGPSCDPNDSACVEGGISQAGMSFDPTSLAANPFAYPCGVWSSPEAAYYGLSVQQASAMGVEAGESMALYSECLRGRVFSPNGLLKVNDIYGMKCLLGSAFYASGRSLKELFASRSCTKSQRAEFSAFTYAVMMLGKLWAS
jgi:NAD(P) transhydrogenase